MHFSHRELIFHYTAHTIIHCAVAAHTGKHSKNHQYAHTHTHTFVFPACRRTHLIHFSRTPIYYYEAHTQLHCTQLNIQPCVYALTRGKKKTHNVARALLLPSQPASGGWCYFFVHVGRVKMWKIHHTFVITFYSYRTHVSVATIRSVCCSPFGSAKEFTFPLFLPHPTHLCEKG